MQAMTSAGVIIIDGDEKHLTEAPGCDNMLSVLPNAPEQVLFIQTMFFNSTSIFDAPMFNRTFGAAFDSSLQVRSSRTACLSISYYMLLFQFTYACSLTS